jgi:hypothetical protein
VGSARSGRAREGNSVKTAGSRSLQQSSLIARGEHRPRLRQWIPNGASPQPDEACWPALVVVVSRPGLVDGLQVGLGVVRRLRPRVARGGWPSRS